MCRQVGLLCGRKPHHRWPDRFASLLQACEAGGPDASGLAVIQRDGRHCITKRPGPVSALLGAVDDNHALSQWDEDTVAVLGHTRRTTRGSVDNPLNNHPLRRGQVIATHNGTLFNADRLFEALGLPRLAEVDSELLVQIANHCLDDEGLDLDLLRRAVALCVGQLSAVLVALTQPDTLVVLKGNKPLSFAVHPRNRTLLYATDSQVLALGIGNERGWEPLAVPSMTIAVFRRDAPTRPVLKPFDFHTRGRGTWL